MKKITSLAALLVIILSFFTPLAFSEKPKSGWFSFKGSNDRLGVVNEPTVNSPFKIVWSYTPDIKTNGFVDWGPVAANGVVYTSDGLNNVLAFKADTGALVWKKSLPSNVFSVSLSADVSRVYVTIAITTKPTPTLFALDPKTGEIIWDNMINGQPAMGGMEGSPGISGGKIFTGSLQYEGQGGVAAFDEATGKLLWQWQLTRFSPYSSITVADERVYVGFENKTLYCLNAASGQVEWYRDKLPDLPFAAPVVSNGKVYFGTGTVLNALDAKTGGVVWQTNLEGQIGHSSVSIYEKTLYVGTRESKVMAVNAETGAVLWVKDTENGPIESSPVINSDRKVLYIATGGNALLTMSLKNGEIADRFRLSADERGVWKSAPALYEGRVYVGSLDRTFYALE